MSTTTFSTGTRHPSTPGEWLAPLGPNDTLGKGGLGLAGTLIDAYYQSGNTDHLSGAVQTLQHIGNNIPDQYARALSILAFVPVIYVRGQRQTSGFEHLGKVDKNLDIALTKTVPLFRRCQEQAADRKDLTADEKKEDPSEELYKDMRRAMLTLCTAKFSVLGTLKSNIGENGKPDSRALLIPATRGEYESAHFEDEAFDLSTFNVDEPTLRVMARVFSKKSMPKNNGFAGLRINLYSLAFKAHKYAVRLGAEFRPVVQEDGVIDYAMARPGETAKHRSNAYPIREAIVPQLQQQVSTALRYKEFSAPPRA